MVLCLVTLIDLQTRPWVCQHQLSFLFIRRASKGGCPMFRSIRRSSAATAAVTMQTCNCCGCCGNSRCSSCSSNAQRRVGKYEQSARVVTYSVLSTRVCSASSVFRCHVTNTAAAAAAADANRFTYLYGLCRRGIHRYGVHHWLVNGWAGYCYRVCMTCT